MQNQAPLTK